MKDFGKKVFKKLDLTKILKTILVKLKIRQKTVRTPNKRLVNGNLIYKNIDQKKHSSNNKDLSR